MDYFKLFAYTSFLFGIITIIGFVLYWADSILDPEPQDETEARHRA